MKISEMTEDQVRDYALKLEQEKQEYIEREKQHEKDMSEMVVLNKQLQKRNNDLFMQVEQQNGVDDHKDPTPPKEEKVESCEDFAKRLLNGGN